MLEIWPILGIISGLHLENSWQSVTYNKSANLCRVSRESLRPEFEAHYPKSLDSFWFPFCSRVPSGLVRHPEGFLLSCSTSNSESSNFFSRLSFSGSDPNSRFCLRTLCLCRRRGSFRCFLKVARKVFSPRSSRFAATTDWDWWV